MEFRFLNIIGYTCGGKTTLARALQESGWIMIDEDEFLRCVKSLMGFDPAKKTMDLSVDERVSMRELRHGIGDAVRPILEQFYAKVFPSQPHVLGRAVALQLWLGPLPKPWVNVWVGVKRPDCISQNRGAEWDAEKHFAEMDQVRNTEGEFDWIDLLTDEQLSSFAAELKSSPVQEITPVGDRDPGQTSDATEESKPDNTSPEGPAPEQSNLLIVDEEELASALTAMGYPATTNQDIPQDVRVLWVSVSPPPVDKVVSKVSLDRALSILGVPDEQKAELLKIQPERRRIMSPFEIAQRF